MTKWSYWLKTKIEILTKSDLKNGEIFILSYENADR